MKSYVCRRLVIKSATVVALLASPCLGSAQTAFSPPDGGWDYLYQGDVASYGVDSGFDSYSSLDGTWSHDNGSDQWDGSGLGGDFGEGNGPGGAETLLEGDTNFLRIQDTGNPTNYGYPDPSNRKVYLGHDLTADGVSDTIMDDGVTLYFRARIPTGDGLDPLHRAGQEANGTQPYPEGGDGYVTSDGGKGNFVIKQAAGGAIAFSLAVDTDTPGGDPTSGVTGFTGLTMNEFDGNMISGNVNFGQGAGENVIALDPTEWHEFWITIRKDEAGVGTHIAAIYVDGATSPKVFKMTAGTGSDYNGSYLAMGATATPQNAALDIDFFGYKVGAVAPASKSFADPDGGWDYGYEGDVASYGVDSGFDSYSSLDGTWSHDNGSDQWDGSGLGGDFGEGNGPGGAEILQEGDTNFLRIQDTGNPTNYGYPDPSNRKVYLGHDLANEGASDTVMDDGVTLYFRARIPTGDGLDPLHRAGQEANGTQPYPEGGDGYVTSDGGKGNFVIKQAAGGAIAFSLAVDTDTPGGDPTSGVTGFTGLTMNEFDGNMISGNVNFGQGAGENVIALDPTEWHDFWITISKDEAGVGTHIASIYVDGDIAPRVFKMTAGTGSDYNGSYLAMGATATPQNAALDVDFYRVKLGAFPPSGASSVLPPDFSDLSPGIGDTSVDPTVGIRFVATSEGSIPQDGIQVILNGRDYSGDLTITGNEQRWEVSLTTLDPNAIYEGRLIITDAEGASIESTLAFDTFRADHITIEGEDYNFEGGQFIEPVILSFDPGPDNYLDRFATADIDAFELTDPADNGAFQFYRIGDIVGTIEAGDVERQQFVDYPQLDGALAAVLPGEWVNYTRTIPAGEYGIVGRIASGQTFSADVGLINGTATTANQNPTAIGNLSGDSTGGNTRFRYVTMRDGNGDIATFQADGVSTLRFTTVEGDYRVNFYFVIPADELPQDGGGSSEPATLAISNNGDGTVTVTWDNDGTLESAPSILGPWNNEAATGNSWTGSVSGDETYFRVVGN